MKSGVSLKQKHKKERQESLRELLSKQGHLQHVIDCIGKLENLDEELNSVEVQRLNAAITTRMKLINKYLPDLKAVELSGPGGDPISVNGFQVTGVNASNKDS